MNEIPNFIADESDETSRQAEITKIAEKNNDDYILKFLQKNTQLFSTYCISSVQYNNNTSNNLLMRHLSSGSKHDFDEAVIRRSNATASSPFQAAPSSSLATSFENVTMKGSSMDCDDCDGVVFSEKVNTNALILAIGSDIFAHCLSYLTPTEVFSFLSLPLSKTFRENYALP